MSKESIITEDDKLFLTKKELKLIRNKEKEQKEKPVNKTKDFDKRSEKYEEISRKIQMVKPKRSIEETRFNEDNNEVKTSSGVPDLVKPKGINEAGKVIQNQVARPPMDESGDVDLNKLFSSEVGNESDVVKELFSSENIKVKTELTHDEIKIISRLELQASMTQNFFLAKIVKEYETLLVSKGRESRKEFVQSFSGVRTGSQDSVFNKIGQVFSKDKV